MKGVDRYGRVILETGFDFTGHHSVIISIVSSTSHIPVTHHPVVVSSSTAAYLSPAAEAEQLNRQSF